MSHNRVEKKKTMKNILMELMHLSKYYLHSLCTVCVIDKRIHLG